MPQNHSQQPELDFEPWEEVLARWRRAERRTPTDNEDLNKLAEQMVKQGRRPANNPRMRSRRTSSEHVRHSRPDGRVVRHYGGVVEIANQPGMDFDYRVSVRPSPDGHIEVDGFAMIAREGDEPVTVQRLREERPGSVIALAVRFLTEPETFRGTVADGDARAVMAPSRGKSHGRPASEEVDRQVRRAAEVYKKAMKDGRPTGAAVAADLGVSESVARKRIEKARGLGIGGLTRAPGTTRPRKP